MAAQRAEAEMAATKADLWRALVTLRDAEATLESMEVEEEVVVEVEVEV